MGREAKSGARIRSSDAGRAIPWTDDIPASFKGMAAVSEFLLNSLRLTKQPIILRARDEMVEGWELER